MCVFGLVCFFKQKTAYEMRISDWSSDVCSSDLMVDAMARPAASSFALLMRLPVDRRSIAVLSALPAAAEALDARSAEELVPITVMIIPFRSLSGDRNSVV